MTPDEAQALADATRAAIDTASQWGGLDDIDVYCREQVASDVAGLQRHAECDDYRCVQRDGCPDARAFAEGLRRTARLYGVPL